jgi:hypothetical protein
MAKLDPQRLIFGLFLIVLIVIAEVVLNHLKLPSWPAFMIMIFFFMEHMDVGKVPGMLVGGLFGIGGIILLKFFIQALAPSLGMELPILIFVAVFVYLIVAFGEMLPIIFNNYAFMFFMISALAVKTPNPNPFVWMAIEVVGGGIFIAAIVGILRLLSGGKKSAH